MPLVALIATAAACTGGERAPASSTRPSDTPALHHVGLNSVDVDAAIDWYLRLWPTAARGSFAGMPSVEAEMLLVLREVTEQPAGAFEPTLGRPAAQSAFWHIGAFLNTTDSDAELAAIGVRHLTLFTGPDDQQGVWRSGLTPYPGTLTEAQIAVAESPGPRPGGFSYVLGPDGALFELTGGPTTPPSLSHVHFFHEQPQCAANWYVDYLGMTLPPARDDDASTSGRHRYEPCEAELGAAGWPSLERAGTIRQPRATVRHANGAMSFYPRQCVLERCGAPQRLVPSRGQVLDHVGFAVSDVDAWYSWLTARGVTVVEEIHVVDEGRAFMFEGPDALAIEFVELGG